MPTDRELECTRLQVSASLKTFPGDCQCFRRIPRLAALRAFDKQQTSASDLRRHIQVPAVIMLLPSAFSCDEMDEVAAHNSAPTTASIMAQTQRVLSSCRVLQGRLQSSLAPPNRPCVSAPSLASPIHLEPSSPCEARKRMRHLSRPPSARMEPCSNRTKSPLKDCHFQSEPDYKFTTPSRPLPFGILHAPQQRPIADDQGPDSPSDTALMATILDKLRLKHSDWDRCGQQVRSTNSALAHDSLGRRWHAMVGEQRRELVIRRSSGLQRRQRLEGIAWR